MSAGTTRTRARPTSAPSGGPVPPDPRFTDRRRAIRRRRLVPLALALLAALVIAGGSWMVFGSSYLGVRAVVVSGTHRLSSESVRQAAAVPAGAPLARLDLAGIAARVRRLTLVRSAVVTRSWPNTLDIVITERTPASVGHRSDGRWELLDATGVWLGAETVPPPGLPIVALDVSSTDPATTRAAAQVAAALPRSLRAQVKDITAASPDSVQLDLLNGAVVRWGSAQDDTVKAEVLRVLLKQRARAYDVTAPGFATSS